MSGTHTPAHLQTQAAFIKAVGMALGIHPGVDLHALQPFDGPTGSGRQEHPAVLEVRQDRLLHCTPPVAARLTHAVQPEDGAVVCGEGLEAEEAVLFNHVVCAGGGLGAGAGVGLPW